MDFSLNDFQRMLQDSAQTFAQEHGDYERRRQLMRSPIGHSEKDWALMAELGWLALLLPEEHGGIGGGPVEAMIVMEALGQSLALEPFFSTAVLGAGCLLRHGSKEHRAALLPSLGQGELRMALAHAEHGAYQNRYRVGLNAQRSGGGFVLSGIKHIVFDASSAQRFIVSARTAGATCERDGITLFLVDAQAEGIERKDFCRLDGGRASHLTFNATALSAAEVLGSVDQGAAVIDDLYAHGIAALCGEALGLMQVMHDASLEYLKVRKQFGRAIGSFQALQHRQVDMFSALEEARSLTLAANMGLAEDMPQADRLLSMAKAMVGRAGKTIGQGAIQLHGGIGMTEELNIGAYFKRMTVIDAMFGTTQEHLARLAGHSPS